MALCYDPEEAVAHLCANDKRLGKIINAAGACNLASDDTESPFDSLLRTIIYQQLAGAAAAKIHGRVAALLPQAKTKRPTAFLQLPDEDLRRAGLSANKLKSLRDLATKTVEKTVPTRARLQKMSDEEIIERLTSVHGIGEWTVHMLLMFQLGRPDILPTGDYGVQKGFMLVYKTAELPKPKQMIAHAERWRPYRSVASWYLWRAVDLAGRKKIVLPNASCRKKSAGAKKWRKR
ncbi:MAG: DNA-3-methyladenine glycosylase [Pirellulales bacterium]|nr:DNA-3-methyladenine glycosylase [Pirellulales bacterium]